MMTTTTTVGTMTTATTTMTTTEPTAPQGGTGWRRTMRKRLSGIRLRIVLGYVVLLVASFAVAIVSTRQYVLARVDDDIDERLLQEIEELRALAGGDNPQTARPFGADVRAIFTTFLSRNVPDDDETFFTYVDGEPYENARGADELLIPDEALQTWWVGATRPRWATHDTASGEVRSLAVPTGGPGARDPKGVFVIAYLPADDRGEALGSVRVLTVAGLIVLGLSALVAWSIADRVVRPVRELTDAAARISHSDLSARIPVTGHDEVAELGESFNAMVQRLDESFEYQRQFLDDVAHELRTPITIARGHIETLGGTPGEREETVAIVSDELDRMARYVSDLLVLAKAGHPDFLRLGPVDLGDLACTVHQRIEAIGDRRWVLDEAPGSGTVAVVADEERLIQAVVNLATNAVQHTVEGDEIGLGVRHHGGSYDLWVRDTGDGIDESVLGGLFTRYSRGASSRVTRPEGMGIGLSIVDAIARAHGGSVSATSPPGSGATFVITCPDEPEIEGQDQ
jgi:two-component system OmpR family sensor kinase